MPKTKTKSKQTKSSKQIYLGLLKEKGIYLGHIISPTPPTPPSEKDVIEPTKASSAEVEIKNEKFNLSFGDVFESFCTIMETYRKFIALTLQVAPALSLVVANQSIAEYANKRGKHKKEHSLDNMDVFEFDMGCYVELKRKCAETNSAIEGAKHLPEVMVIGLVSAYDAFLSNLLRVALNTHPQIVMTSDRTIKFSELTKFDSIDDARTHIIEGKIEEVMRSSHHEQINEMQKLFKLDNLEAQLCSDLPAFVELCERRNLLTHTGGIISKQYLQTCKQYQSSISNINVGEKIVVDSKYFTQAVRVIYNLGVKLCCVLWLKLAKPDIEAALNHVNSLAFNLISWEEYQVAESILRFCLDLCKKQNKIDSVRRMLVVNLANAIKLQGRTNDANVILDGEDWSATQYLFQISVAAVKNDVDKVIELMGAIGDNSRPDAEDYRTWPVFNSLRTNDKFIEKYEKIFKQPFILDMSNKADIKEKSGENVPATDNVIPLKPDKQIH